MDALASDLSSLLQEAMSRLGTAARIWVRASITYDSRLVWRRGIPLGGSWSPFFLLPKSGASGVTPNWRSTGGGIELYAPAVLHLDQVTGQLAEWVPLLERTARGGTGLLVVANSVEPGEALKTLLVNNERDVVSSAVVKPGSGSVPPLWKSQLSKLPVYAPDKPTDFALVRRSASVVFLKAAEEQKFHGYLSDMAIIQVGGEDYDDFTERFKSLTNAVLHLDGHPH